MFSFTVLTQDKQTSARTGIIHTPHGDIETPAFVPVGTQATVKSLSPDDLSTLSVSLYFVNTYHMVLRPGVAVIKKAGGLHSFMHWNRPLITDSGGFQVFSLGRPKGHTRDTNQAPTLVKISQDEVLFRSHWDGELITLSPQSSMEYQWALGSDIHIAFDDCTPYPVTYQTAKSSMERTHQWALRSIEAHKELAHVAQKKNQPYQALYGSIQGSVFEDLRRTSAQYIAALEIDGIAIGGVSVGESKQEMSAVLDWVYEYLPEDKPRHLLGVGEIDDIFTLVSRGIDTFDCVLPTRLARNGYAYISPTVHSGKVRTNSDFLLDISRREWQEDFSPLDSRCNCYVCITYTKAYLHHLFRVKELLVYRLLSIHNIHFIQQLVTVMRKAVTNGTFLDLKNQWLYDR